MLQLSLQSELNNFFSSLLGDPLPRQRISDVALCKARQKILPQVFSYLLRTLSDLFYNCPTAPRWHGMRLIAIDGTTLYLPHTDDIAKFFPVQQKGDGAYILSQASFAYDPLSHLVIDARMSSYQTSEQELFYQHSHYFRPTDLILADRGYTGLWLMALLRSKGCHFCIRHQEVNTYRKVKEFIASGQKEQIVELMPSKKSIPRLKEKHLPRQNITVRLIRIELPGGKTEILMTSLLDNTAYPHELFGELYHLRWPVEEGYKSFKSKLKVENFTSKTAQGIEQDFFAKAFMLSFCGLIEFATQEGIEQAEKKKKRKGKYKMMVNRAFLHNVLKRTFTGLWIKAVDLTQFIVGIVEVLLDKLQPIRPGRAAPRNYKSQKRYYMTVKQSH